MNTMNVSDAYVEGFRKAAEEAGVDPDVLCKAAAGYLGGSFWRGGGNAINAAGRQRLAAPVRTTVPYDAKHHFDDSAIDNIRTALARRSTAGKIIRDRYEAARPAREFLRGVKPSMRATARIPSPDMYGRAAEVLARENPALQAQEFSRNAQNWRPRKDVSYTAELKTPQRNPWTGKETRPKVRISGQHDVQHQLAMLHPNDRFRIEQENSAIENAFRPNLHERPHPDSAATLVRKSHARLRKRMSDAGIGSASEPWTQYGQLQNDPSYLEHVYHRGVDAVRRAMGA